MVSEPILQINHLTAGYNDAESPVLKDLNFTINQGDFLSIVGENGVGKTTLMRTILRQLKPLKGNVDYFPSAHAVNIGYVPQFRNIDSEYPLSIRDFVGLNLTGFKLPWLSRSERKRVNDMLVHTGLQDLANRPMGQASGGEKQKAYLAQALVEEPDLLILDESTASLDPVSKNELLNLVEEINQKLQVTVIFVTHDIALAKKYASKFLLLAPGTYVSGNIDELTNDKVWGMMESHV
ncbi:hypothetical protein C5L31_000726 [Secundilactobacillus malefermentans]|uniref:ABC transporter domain-containing protein n=1 Tax=Secundilactobacillus malefermentans TaxID=176292 RepID=A0A4R5NR64_9LACO|nr:hypothetical protein C5L31_000726 [Secundilactobacillus malefermentans]